MSQELTKYSFDEDLEGEEWRDAVGYEGFYIVSNMGRVRSLDRMRNFMINKRCLYVGGLVKSVHSKIEYGTVRLSVEGKKKTKYIHHLVAQAFMNHTPNVKMIIDHINGDRKDARLSNLQIITQSENIRKSKNPISGHYGVYRDESKSGNKWRVRIRINKTPISLGYQPTLKQAITLANMGYENEHLFNGDKIRFKQLILNKYYEQSATKN